MIFDKYLIQKNSSILKAIDKLNNSGEKTLIVVDEKKTINGTLSDGDIRKYIKKEKNLKLSISKIYNKKPFTVSKNYNTADLIKIFKLKKYDFIPVINKNKKIIDIIFWSQLLNSQKKRITDFDVIILAGGLGKRLLPYSAILPKPLFFYDGKTITEKIIHQFAKFGFLNFLVSLNYKKNIIKSYLDNFKPYFNINYMIENKQLGTAGPLSLISKNQKKSFFLINCDTLITADLRKIYKYHNDGNYLMTIITTNIDFTLDYGILNLDNKNQLNKVLEKPKISKNIITGLYLFNPKILEFIPKNKKYDMNELINKLLIKKEKIGIFKISNKFWKDISKHETFDKF